MELTHEDLQLLTNNFSPHNYTGRTHFGVLYRGIIPEGWNGIRSGEATIKIWKNEQFIHNFRIVEEEDPEQVRFRMEQEIRFLQQPEIAMHPYTVNVIGCCFDAEKLGVVYDLKPLQTLQKYIDNENFGWLKRVKVALKLACLLKFFHQNVPQYIVRNLSPAHVMLDQDLNPVVIDYAMIHGGSYVDLLTLGEGAPLGSRGYVDLYDLQLGKHSQKTDIFAYGVILLELLGRCAFDSKYVMEGSVWKGPPINIIAEKEFYMHQKAKRGSREFGYSFAHQYLRDDPDYDACDGNKISMVALKCSMEARFHRPTMGEVMKELKELKLVKSHRELKLVKSHRELLEEK